MPCGIRVLALASCALALAPGCSRSESSERPNPAGQTAIVPTPSASLADSASAPSAGHHSPNTLYCDGASLYRRREGAEPELVERCYDIERCDAERGSCEPACPDDSVYIPPTGPEGFVMGRNMTPFGFGSRKSGEPGHGQSDTPHRVVLTKPFCMDKTEVTAGAMVACVRERGCIEPSIMDRWATYPNKPDYPANMVDWKKSKVFCDKNDKSLPTEAQWEWAASGGDGRKWPWGDAEPTCTLADFTAATLVSPGGDSGCHGGGPSKVGAHPDGDRIWPTGRIHDLAGNVWEWCLDTYLPYPPSKEVDPLPLRGEGGNHVVRGGGWNRSARGIQTAFRGAAIVTYQVPGLGFRCVRNAK